MYQPYDREKSRERSRDKRTHGRSPSEDETAHDRKDRARTARSRVKRVKFEGNDDIRVFRKEDQPTAKGLAEEDILKIKAEIEKEIAKSYDFNWEHYKHRDALLESNSMKEQKEREKALSEKLMAARELITYAFPQRLAKIENIIQAGCESLEKDAHTSRIHDILGCYYTHIDEIPNEPAFEILNTQPTSECKTIKFDNDIFPDEPTTIRKTQENSRPLKGILKLPNTNERVERAKSESRQIDPQLIFLLKDFKMNPQLYSAEKTQQLLKPYRDSGELDYLMRNKEVLQAMVKNASSAPQVKPQPMQVMGGGHYKDSVERSGSTQPNVGMGQPHHFIPKAEKFRTVPCKYYHSPQGCSKVDNCTFIHDDRFPGVSVPSNRADSGSQQQSRVPSYPPNPSVPYYPSSMPSNPSNLPGNSDFYNPAMGYTAPAPYPGYYGGPTGSYQSGYQMGKSGSQYSPQGSVSAPQQPYTGQGYPPQGYTQGQGYGSQQGQYSSPGSQPFSNGSQPFNNGSQAFSNPNMQYYIGNNPNK